MLRKENTGSGFESESWNFSKRSRRHKAKQRRSARIRFSASSGAVASRCGSSIGSEGRAANIQAPVDDGNRLKNFWLLSGPSRLISDQGYGSSLRGLPLATRVGCKARGLFNCLRESQRVEFCPDQWLFMAEGSYGSWLFMAHGCLCLRALCGWGLFMAEGSRTARAMSGKSQEQKWERKLPCPESGHSALQIGRWQILVPLSR